jgi:hypothetical protein
MIGKQGQASLSIVSQYVGRSFKAIYRVFAFVDGVTEGEDGFLQLEFSGDEWLLLLGYSDGQTFLAKPELWHDPLQGPLDAETATWVKDYGKDELIEVSELDQYKDLIGKPLTHIRGILYQIGAGYALCGVQMIFEDKTLNFVYVADDCLIKETLENPPFSLVDADMLLKET